ncbi:MAG: class I SAM-dependent methyltransferase [Alphaproteobacteria bacterium]|nr:class I SAM-dependent methyltransferase [Alphaproteobacteria bacterium]
MARVHLVELEDQPWFPAVIRDGGTAYLAFALKTFRHTEKIVPPVVDLIRETGATRVVDLCSGGSGPLVALDGALQAAGLDVALVATDLYPNTQALDTLRQDTDGRVRRHPEPVDARAVPESLAGVRTIFNAFHHFRPDDARAILADAVARGQPIAVVEVVGPQPAFLLPMPLAPLFTALSAPFWRPFRWTNLFFSWVIPLIPLLVLWDGLVSCLRVYQPAELEALTRDLGEGYRWEILRIPLAPGAPATVMLGRPEAGQAASSA